ncbi:MAG: hypothetical protein KDD44_09925, partial [Bdellovibrionales bacterium]|nr:hypothetical protein [Bdellovibrionales bacterium]
MTGFTQNHLASEDGVALCEYVLLLSLIGLVLLMAVSTLATGAEFAFADASNALGGGTNQIVPG